MRSMTAVFGVQTMTVAPVSRAHTGIALSSYRPVSGQECFGSAVVVSPVESVSGACLPAAVASLGLVALGAADADALLGLCGYAGGEHLRRGPEQAWLIERQGRNQVLEAQDGNDGTFSATESMIDSTNGSKPMNPWDFRTSSPPG